MKAWVYRRYGPPDVLGLEEVEPPAPGTDEIAIRVRAIGLNAADWHLMRADPFIARLSFGLRRPRRPMIPGCDVAGVVEKVGERVTSVAPGDEVMANVGFSGGLAEHATTGSDGALARKPAGASFEQAAAVPISGVAALRAIRDAGRVEHGQTVLVIGASGGVGTFAVQIAKALGGVVTGVCSTAAVDLVRSLGATDVLDYTKGPVVDTGRTYDVVVNNGGTHSLGALRRTTTPKGTIVTVGGSQRGGLFGPGAVEMRSKISRPFVSQRIASVSGDPRASELETLASMIESGDVTPAIDRTYPFTEAPEALRYLEDGHPKGKVVVAAP